QPPFEAEIRAFERLDSIEKPAKGQILLFGSSTMRLWKTYKSDLAGYQVVNRGFGGSQMSDAVHYFDQVVVPLAPSWILLYEGDNDISNGKKTPEQVLKDFETFMQLVKEKLPKTKVAIYTLRPSVVRENLMPQQRQLNALFKKYCKKHKKKAYFIDVYDLLLTPAGKPNPEYLDADKLHLNAKGYEVWAKETKDFLKRMKV
ncbi:MAG TPA: GDSL-type esterase/lipase family protein, partial [Saprospiraceae bacterium]|nr:GDSL-type esterase/lipase family protein [Saprospiraceae bacterium]